MVKPVIGERGLLELFSLGPARSPDFGVFEDIQELPPAHSLHWQGGRIKLTQYWQLEASPQRDTLGETIEKTRGLLTDAIKRQLISDVPLCTFLSGGLDSSAISAVAAQHLGELDTWSLDYQDNSRWFKKSNFQPDPDSNWIGLMSQTIGSQHQNVEITAEQLAASLRNATLASDLPGMADIDSSLYLFSQAVSKKATVALSGECADEIFGGYPWFWQPELLNSNTFPWSNALKLRRSLLGPDLRHLDIEGYADNAYKTTLAQVPHLEGESPEEIKMRQMYWLNIRWFMLTLLNRKDRMTMANSLEVRVPFADHRIVEYAFNIPWSMKYLNSREKGLLREALKGILPEPILERRKSPWPKTHNPHYHKLVKQQLQDILASNSPLKALINLDTVNNIMENQISTPWFGQLMTGPQLMAYLVQLDTWLREYKVYINI